MSTNETLLTQPTAALTRKQFWGNMAKGGVVIGVWAVGEFTDITITAVIAATITMMAGSVVGYFVRDRVI